MALPHPSCRGYLAATDQLDLSNGIAYFWHTISKHCNEVSRIASTDLPSFYPSSHHSPFMQEWTHSQVKAH